MGGILCEILHGWLKPELLPGAHQSWPFLWAVFEVHPISVTCLLGQICLPAFVHCSSLVDKLVDRWCLLGCLEIANWVFLNFFPARVSKLFVLFFFSLFCRCLNPVCLVQIQFQTVMEFSVYNQKPFTKFASSASTFIQLLLLWLNKRGWKSYEAKRIIFS